MRIERQDRDENKNDIERDKESVEMRKGEKGKWEEREREV